VSGYEVQLRVPFLIATGTSRSPTQVGGSGVGSPEYGREEVDARIGMFGICSV